MKVPRGRGSYDRRIQFFQATVAQDSSGSVLRTWPTTPFARRWAQQTAVPPSLLRDERFENQQWVGKTWVSFRVPYDDDIYAKLSTADIIRIKDAFGLVYDVIQVEEFEDTRRKIIDLMAYRRTDKAEVVV